jgi:hypothetical protein
MNRDPARARIRPKRAAYYEPKQLPSSTVEPKLRKGGAANLHLRAVIPSHSDRCAGRSSERTSSFQDRTVYEQGPGNVAACRRYLGSEVSSRAPQAWCVVLVPNAGIGFLGVEWKPTSDKDFKNGKLLTLNGLKNPPGPALIDTDAYLWPEHDNGPKASGSYKQ